MRYVLGISPHPCLPPLLREIHLCLLKSYPMAVTLAGMGHIIFWGGGGRVHFGGGWAGYFFFLGGYIFLRWEGGVHLRGGYIFFVGILFLGGGAFRLPDAPRLPPYSRKLSSAPGL